MPDARPSLPPFTFAAPRKARPAEDAWHSCDSARVALAYAPDSRWRDRGEFFTGRAAIRAFLTRKWAQEHEYRLIKDLWSFHENRIAVRFQYGYHDAQNQWLRAYGNEQGNSTPRASCSAAKPASTTWPLRKRTASSTGPKGPGRPITQG